MWHSSYEPDRYKNGSLSDKLEVDPRGEYWILFGNSGDCATGVRANSVPLFLVHLATLSLTSSIYNVESLDYDK
jgi:hypothetical protein